MFKLFRIGDIGAILPLCDSARIDGERRVEKVGKTIGSHIRASSVGQRKGWSVFAGNIAIAAISGFLFYNPAGAQEIILDPTNLESAATTEVAPIERMPTGDGDQPQNTALFDSEPANDARALQINRWNLDLTLGTSVYFDDNIYLREENAEEDIVITIQPGVILGLGDSSERQDNYTLFSYRPTGFLFTDNSAENSLDHDVRFDIQYRVQRLTLGAKLEFFTVSGAERETAGRVDRSVYRMELRASYELTPKMDLETDLEFLKRDYKNRVDSTLAVSNTFLTYKTTERLRLGGGLAFGVLDVEESGSQTFEQLLLKVRYESTEKFTLDMKVGVEFRQFEDRSDRFNPVFAIKGIWTPLPNLRAQLEGYRRSRSAPTDRGSDFTETGVAASLRQRLLQKWEVALEGGYENADYFAVRSDETESDRSDDYFFGRLSLSYKPAEWLGMEIFYRYRQNDSTTNNLSFENSQVGFAVNLLF